MDFIIEIPGRLARDDIRIGVQIGHCSFNAGRHQEVVISEVDRIFADRVVEGAGTGSA